MSPRAGGLDESMGGDSSSGEPEPMSEKQVREAQAVIDVFGLKMVRTSYFILISLVASSHYNYYSCIITLLSHYYKKIIKKRRLLYTEKLVVLMCVQVTGAYSKQWSYREDALLAVYKILEETPTVHEEMQQSRKFQLKYCFFIFLKFL